MERRLSHQTPIDGRSAEVARLTERLDRRRAPRWVGTAAAHLRRALRFGERLLDRVASE
jgi:hypothetical protein